MRIIPASERYLVLIQDQNKLEAQYAAKRDAHLGEVADLKQQLELRQTEIRNLSSTIDGLKGVNEELKVVSNQNTRKLLLTSVF